MEQKLVIAIVGGVSHQSSENSSRLIYDMFFEKTNGLVCPEMVVYDLDMCKVEKYQKEGNKDALRDILGRAVYRLGHWGAEADFAILCSNTLHEFSDLFDQYLPLLDIRETTVQAVKKQGFKKVALLGTKYTMEEDFYVQYLEKEGLEVVIPEIDDRNLVHRIIYDELCKGAILGESETLIQEIINCLQLQGAEGVILGCTELPLLIKAASIPVFNTTQLQAEAAVDKALGLDE